MSQGSRKSAVYIPFVGCDDPKGVVDGTIKKSKPQKMKSKIDDCPRNPKNFSKSSSCKEVRKESDSGGIRGKLHTQSSFQASDISRGTEKLNDAINTLSKGLHSDLLRGALDLQESLVMLGKLRKASEHVSKLKKKNQKKKSEKERVDEAGIEEMRPCQLRDSLEKMGFQGSQLSADGCSRDSYKELRKAIRGGLARQNLLMDTDNEEEAYFGPRKLDLASELATTCSSRFPMVHSEAFFTSTDYSLSSKAQNPLKKTTGPNVVARLMGLEDMPSKPLKTTPKLAVEKFVDQKEMPRGRKPQLVNQKVEPEQPTPTSAFETVQFKGLLKSNFVRRTKSDPHSSNAAYFKESLIDDAPPIVIMKPLNLGCPLSSETYMSTAIGEEYLTAKEVLRELKLKKEFPTIEADWKRGSFSSNSKHRTVGGEGIKIKRLGQEEVTEECKEVIVVSESIKVKPKERTCSDTSKASTPVRLKPEKKEVIDHKSCKIQEAALFSRRKMMQEDSNSIVVPKTQDQAYAHNTKLRNSESGLTRTKNQPCERQNTAPYTILTSTKQSISHTRAYQEKNRMEEEESAKKVKGANTVVGEKFECKDEARRTGLPSKTDSILTTINTTAAEQLLAKEPADAFEIQLDELADGVTASTTQHEGSVKSAEVANDVISHRAMKRRSSGARASMKALLLSSPSFLNRAEELFDLNMNQLITLQAYDIKEFSPKLSLDCANEILERKNFRGSWRLRPPLQTSISMDRLVEEVCDGLEDLRSYGNLTEENLPLGSLCSVVEKDIRTQGVESGTWAFGWMNEFSVDDVEPVVGEIDQLILSNLIEEILKDSLL